MKKFVVRLTAIVGVLACTVSVAASVGPNPRTSDDDHGPIACWPKGTMCKGGAECCHHRCAVDSSDRFHHMRCL